MIEKLKIFAVISYSYVGRGSISVPFIHYFSLDKSKCEDHILEYEKKNPFWKGNRKIKELESEKDLGYLCSMVKW